MKYNLFLTCLILILSLSCNNQQNLGDPEVWKKEIRQAEQDFARLAGEKGLRQAFLTFAAEDAVLMRNNNLVSGKDEISIYFENRPSAPPNEKLIWTPDFVDVSASGDLGYTYGKYVYSYSDSLGISQENTGIFHTVWKRQNDGKWRFVWD